jgi:uncharacterized membrane protein YcgQ (UPF0703/DUF1980 family)
MLKQLDAVAFFIIIGFLSTYFSKNMIIVMLTSVISTFLLVQIKMLGKVQEGMEDKKEDEPSTEDKADEGEATPAKAAANISAANVSAATPAVGSASATGTNVSQIGANTSSTPVTSAQRAAVTMSTDSTKGTAATEKFSQQITPARYNSADDDDMPRHKPKVDYAATLETAYDNLDKLLSSDAIKNMTADTGRLAEKQQQLMGNIEKIGPIMEKAGSILKGFDMGAITQLMKNVGGSVNMLKENRPDMAAIEAA